MAEGKMSFGRQLLAVVPAAIIFVAWVTGAAVAPEDANRAYFEASAQVIPVLLLALAVESRWLRVSNVIAAPGPFEERARVTDESTFGEFVAAAVFAQLGAWWRGNLIIMLVLPVGLLAAGEWACLTEVARLTEDETANAWLVSGGIAAGLAGVAVIALVGAGVKEPSRT